jgi:CoA:oxalate CoA-transferase
MSVEKDKPLVFSKHLTGKATQKQLGEFNNLLSQMMGVTEGKDEVLSDIKVVEISDTSFVGIITASLLGEFGAEVIKVELPEGDAARKITPYGVNFEGTGLPFIAESRNKYFLTLDYRTEKGKSNLMKLLAQADVIVDATRPGYLDSLGIGYRQLSQNNTRLVYVAISPFGHFTAKAEEFANIPDTDLTAQCESGYPSLIGDPSLPAPYNSPIKAGIWASWYLSAFLAVTSTLTALFYRGKTGEGQMVDVAVNDAISGWLGLQIVWGFTNEMPRVRVGNFDWGLFPYGYYNAKDGYATVTASTDADFRGLLKIFKRWDLENDWRFLFDRTTDDVDKLQDLESEFKKEIAKYSRKELVNKTTEYSASAARDKLRGKGFPIIVETKTPSEVLQEKHWKIRNSIIEIDTPKIGKFMIPNSIPKMSETPPRIKWIKFDLGGDNELIYKKYGLEK